MQMNFQFVVLQVLKAYHDQFFYNIRLTRNTQTLTNVSGHNEALRWKILVGNKQKHNVQRPKHHLNTLWCRNSDSEIVT